MILGKQIIIFSAWVLLIRKLGYEGWKDLKDVGRRWIAEIVFSAIKRVFGEDLLSKKFTVQKIEAGRKIMLYNNTSHCKQKQKLAQTEE